MLRSMGFKKKYLIGVITFKSLSFSVLGLFYGIMVAFILNIMLKEIIFSES